MAKIDIKNELRKVLESNNIPSSEFSLDGFKEQAECLEETKEGYLVYYVERGNKFDVENHEKLFYACYDIISRLAGSEEERKRMHDDFIAVLALEE